MSILVLNPKYSLYVRLNSDIIYVDFDVCTLNLYNFNTDGYIQYPASYAMGSVVTYYLQTESFRGKIEIDYSTRMISISPENELRYFEQELAEVAY